MATKEVIYHVECKPLVFTLNLPMGSVKKNTCMDLEKEALSCVFMIFYKVTCILISIVIKFGKRKFLETLQEEKKTGQLS